MVEGDRAMEVPVQSEGGSVQPPGLVAHTDSSPPKLAVNKSFILSEGLPPVPYKLAAKIWRGDYLDMAELLRDNLEAQKWAVATQHSGLTQKSRREIPDILSNVLAYIWQWLPASFPTA